MALSIINYMKVVDASPEKKKEYDQRYQQIQSDIDANWYSVNKRVILNVKIPSEKAANVKYDVLLEFNVGANATVKEFKTAALKVFSNCPSYIFSNHKFCKSRGCEIGWAEPLLKNTDGKEAEKETTEAKDSQPQTAIKCEKSLYFAMRYLLGLDGIQLLTGLQNCTKLLNEGAILRKIQNPEKKLEKRQDAKPIKQPKKDSRNLKDQKINERVDKMRLSAVTKTTKTSKTIKVKGVRSVSKVKHI